MDSKQLFALFQDLQQYVAWSRDDALRIEQAAAVLTPQLGELIDDFYAEIQNHPQAARVLTGGAGQVQRLKLTLRDWIHELLGGQYDVAYVTRRWQVGRRHVEIGLRQVYVNAALTRLRNGMVQVLAHSKRYSDEQLGATIESLNKLLDIDLAMIGDAYEAEHLRREMNAERERGEDKFRKLVEAATCAVIILRPDGKIAYFSPYAEELTGYEADEVVGADYLSEFLPPNYQNGVEVEIREILLGNSCQGHEAAAESSPLSIALLLEGVQ